MLATTANSTSIHFGVGHMCHRHNQIFSMDHVDHCDGLKGCKNIRSYARRLKEQHLLEWEPEERAKAIAEFALLTLQMKNLENNSQISLVQTQPPSQHIKTGRGRGRPKKITQIAETCTKMTTFFRPDREAGNSNKK